MFQIAPTVAIDTSPEQLWNYLLRIEEWWLPSNPDHISLEILSDNKQLNEGTRIRIRERIAGISGEAEGEIEAVVPQKRVTWRSDRAVYRYFGLSLNVEEGVTWAVKPAESGSELSAHVWAKFPNNVLGRLLEWYFKTVLKGVEKDYEHAMRELSYIKERVEAL